VVHPRLQRVVVARRRTGRVVGLVAQPHADMVGHDAAVTVAQPEDQVPPVVTPRRIAVQHDDHFAIARAFVQVRHRNAGADFDLPRPEWVIGKIHHAHFNKGNCPPCSSRRTSARRIICCTSGTACTWMSSTSGCALANTRKISSAKAWPTVVTSAKSSTTVRNRSTRCRRRLACERETRFSSPTFANLTGTTVLAKL